MKNTSTPIHHRVSISGSKSHRTSTSSAGWALWRMFQVRSAGFSSSLVLNLASFEGLQASDALADARELEDEFKLKLFKKFSCEIGSLLKTRYKLPKGSAEHTSLSAQIKNWRKTEKAIRKKRKPTDVPKKIIAEVEELCLLQQRSDIAQETFEKLYKASVVKCDESLKDTANYTKFIEAIVWQNKPILQHVLEPMANGERAVNKRRNEELVASYLQRYCTKNDMIGYFGPVCWGAWEEDSERAIDITKAGKLAKRTVYFEDWAIQTFADKISADGRMVPWLIPSRSPSVRLEGDRLVMPAGAKIKLTHSQTTLLNACNGTATATQVAQVLLRNPLNGFNSAQEIFDMLAAFARQRRIHLGFGTPAGSRIPELHLRRLLEEIDDAEIREMALEPLVALEHARDHLETSAGNPEAMVQAINKLNKVFEGAAETSAVRNHGETYGSRTIFYEDCLSGSKVDFGPQLLNEIQPPLDLILSSARWFCHALANVYRDSFEAVYATMAKSEKDINGEVVVDLPSFWLNTIPLFEDEKPEAIIALRQELVNKWQSILNVSANQEVRLLSSTEIRSAVLDIFAAVDCGWAAARHHSPDVMIAAENCEAIEKGEFQFVMGEIHVGLNTIMTNCVVNQHVDPNTLFDALHADFGEPRLTNIFSIAASGQPLRTRPSIDPRHDIELCCSFEAIPLNPKTALSVSDFVVARGPKGLVARSRDGLHIFDLLDLFSDRLGQCASNLFSIMPNTCYSPRIVIDKLVIQRRSWRFHCDDFHFLDNKSDSDNFHYMCNWARTLGLPRQVFVKYSWEKKPVYVDFASPLYVRMLVKQLLKDSQKSKNLPNVISFSEMLPSHEQLWMPLVDGGNCTSEFRCVAIHSNDFS